MSSKLSNKKAWRIIVWAIAGAALGVLISSIVCYKQLKMYESRAFLVTRETTGRTVSLSPSHAAQAIRLTSDLGPWKFASSDLVETLCEDTKIRDQNGVVEILVRTPDKERSFHLAIELAWLFRGMDEEAALDHPVSDPPPPTDADLAMMQKRRDIERLMNEETRATTGAVSFRAVPSLVNDPATGARELWESESFKRQWAYHRKITEEIAGQPKSPLPILNLLEFPKVSHSPSSPNVALYQHTGLFVGLAGGMLIGMRRNGKSIPALVTGRNRSPVIPMLQKTGPPPISSSSKTNSRTPDIKDEW